MVSENPLLKVPRHHLRRFRDYTDTIIEGLTEVLLALDIQNDRERILITKEVLSYLYSQKVEIETAIEEKTKELRKESKS